MNVVATCPAGTKLTGCFANPSAFCNGGGNANQNGDVVQALAIIAGNTCVVDYLHDSTACGAFSLNLTATAQCINTP